MLSESEHIRLNKAKWDKWAKSFDKDTRRNNYLRKAQSNLIELLDLHENMSFLDIGCGTGWALGKISERLNNNGIFYGIDLSEKMIEKAVQNFSGKNNFYFVKANAESIPLKNDFFDIIICTNSFHHYLNPVKALSEMKRLLKRNGKLFILDPSGDLLLMKFINAVSKLIEPAHVRLYNTREFKELFIKSGLEYSATTVISAHQKVHVGYKATNTDR